MFDKIECFVLELLYPRRCPLCGRIVLPKGSLACPACDEKEKPITGAVCLHCGKSVAVGMTYCADCKGKESAFIQGFALWNYDAVMKKSIKQFKYYGKREYRDYYVDKLLTVLGPKLQKLQIEAVVPVPVHRKRLRERGFNQAELLAEGIAFGLSLPMLSDFLLRGRATAPQKELDSAQRRRNLTGAFQINRKSRYWNQYWKRVLLVDDIYTTGSTAEACALTLKQAGVGEVYVLCLCIGNGA